MDPGLIPMMLKIGYYVSMSVEYANLLKTIFFMLDAHSTGQTFWTLLEQHVTKKNSMLRTYLPSTTANLAMIRTSEKHK